MNSANKTVTKSPPPVDVEVFTPPQPDSHTIFGIVIGIIGAVGLPKLLQMFAAEKVKSVESGRRREDKILESVLEVNRVMMLSQTNTNQEMLQLTRQLVSEMALLRSVVENNTHIMEEVLEVTQRHSDNTEVYTNTKVS
jgi:Mn2+/Fe2+ NRAMP family transporter